MTEPFERGQVIQQARVHHVLDVVSGIYWMPCVALWESASGTGRYKYDNGSGDHYVIGWGEGGLVVLLFAHEDSERSEWAVDLGERRPLRHLPGLPDLLVELAEDCADLGERLATGGLWIAGDEMALSDPWDAESWWNHGLEMLRGYERGPAEACFDDRIGWAEGFSLERRHAEVAIELAMASANGGVVMTADQVAVLNSPPDGAIVEADNLADARVELAALGIRWPQSSEVT